MSYMFLRIFVLIFSYLGLGLMAARTSILQLGNNGKDCKCLYYRRVSIKNDLVAGERCDVTGEYFERPRLHF